MEDTRNFSTLLSKNCKRKEARKSKKKLGVLCRVAFSKHKNVEILIKETYGESKADKRKEKRQRQKKSRAAKKKTETEEDRVDNLVGFTKEPNQANKQNHSNDEEANAEKVVDDLFAELDDLDEGGSTSEDWDSEMESNDEENGEQNNLNQNYQPPVEFDKSIDKNDEDKQSINSLTDTESKNDNKVAKKLNSKKQLTCLAGYNSELLALAKKAKMNTVLKKQIFCEIMSSLNESQSFERIKKLSINGVNEREIIKVCVKCALLEANYNQYYSVLINLFCESQKRFRVTTQFALWDTIKAIDSLKDHQKYNFSCLIADLLRIQTVGLSIIKILDFSNQTLVSFLRIVIFRLLTKASDYVVREIFVRVIHSGKNEKLTINLEKFLSKLNLEQCRKLGEIGDFVCFQDQLAKVKRLFAV